MEMETNEQRVRAGYSRLVKTLIKRKLTITTMESATGGQIASLITDTSGSSEIFKGAFVTYCNEAKILQGVPKETIEKYSVYSRETAQAMAAACARSYAADIGIGVTGTMGNIDPANEAASVPGEVYFAISFNGKLDSFQVTIPPQPDRLSYKLEAAGEILDRLEKMLCIS